LRLSHKLMLWRKTLTTKEKFAEEIQFAHVKSTRCWQTRANTTFPFSTSQSRLAIRNWLSRPAKLYAISFYLIHTRAHAAYDWGINQGSSKTTEPLNVFGYFSFLGGPWYQAPYPHPTYIPWRYMPTFPSSLSFSARKSTNWNEPAHPSCHGSSVSTLLVSSP
jgi:hypothetical protein